MLMLESPSTDHIELGIVPHRPLHEAGKRSSLQLDQVFAGEVGDEIGGRIDGATVDCLHALNLSRTYCQLACHGTRLMCAMRARRTIRRLGAVPNGI
jgi:hypothetical protein